MSDGEQDAALDPSTSQERHQQGHDNHQPDASTTTAAPSTAASDYLSRLSSIASKGGAERAARSLQDGKIVQTSPQAKRAFDSQVKKVALVLFRNDLR